MGSIFLIWIHTGHFSLDLWLELFSEGFFSISFISHFLGVGESSVPSILKVLYKIEWFLYNWLVIKITRNIRIRVTDICEFPSSAHYSLQRDLWSLAIPWLNPIYMVYNRYFTLLFSYLSFQLPFIFDFFHRLSFLNHSFDSHFDNEYCFAKLLLHMLCLCCYHIFLIIIFSLNRSFMYGF